MSETLRRLHDLRRHLRNWRMRMPLQSSRAVRINGRLSGDLRISLTDSLGSRIPAWSGHATRLVRGQCVCRNSPVVALHPYVIERNVLHALARESWRTMCSRSRSVSRLQCKSTCSLPADATTLERAAACVPAEPTQRPGVVLASVAPHSTSDKPSPARRLLAAATYRRAAKCKRRDRRGPEAAADREVRSGGLLPPARLR